MPRPPALCAHCGHDVARGAAVCGRCSRTQVAWELVPRGDLSDVSSWLTIPLGLALAVALILVRENFPAPQLLLGVGLIGALLLIALIAFLGEAHWTSAVGASATTFHGRLVAAQGSSPVEIVHRAPGQRSVRGELLYDGGGRKADALPAGFDADPVEVALVAAIVGMLAREQITLVESRPQRWNRLGMTRTETARRVGGTFAITLIARVPAGEDAVADLLLGSFYPAVSGDYRSDPIGARQGGAIAHGERRTLSLLEIVRTAFPPAQKPGRTMRRALPRIAHDPAERAALRALLTTISRDERASTWTALRDALRQALALRGKQVA